MARHSTITTKISIGILRAPDPHKMTGSGFQEHPDLDKMSGSSQLARLKIGKSRDFSSTFLNAFWLKTPGKVEANLDSPRLLSLKSRKVKNISILLSQAPLGCMLAKQMGGYSDGCALSGKGTVVCCYQK